MIPCPRSLGSCNLPPGSAGQVFQLSSWIVFPTEGDPSVVVVMGPQTGMPAHGFGKNGSVGQGIFNLGKKGFYQHKFSESHHKHP